jgi:hypothetical protein
MGVYNVFAYRHPVYQPAMRLVTAITNEVIPTVTTSFAHNYLTGTIVRFYIPRACGMQQLVVPVNYIFPAYEITVTGLTTFTIPVNTTYFDVFSIPVTSDYHIDTGAQVVPIGEDSAMLTAATENKLPYPAT